MRIRLTEFRGEVPRASRYALPPHIAERAVNCDLSGGNIAPLPAPAPITEAPESTETIYYYRGRWLALPYRTRVVRSLNALDKHERIYYISPTGPKVRGVVDGEEREYDLGVPAPATAPTCSVRALTDTIWRPEWTYQYEDKIGNVTQTGPIPPDTIVAQQPGSVYRLTAIPPRTTAGAADKFILVLNAYGPNGNYLGTVFPDASVHASESSFYTGHHRVAAKQRASGGVVYFTLSYTQLETQLRASLVTERRYCYTWVSVMGEEGPPSDFSPLVSVAPTQECVLTGFDTNVPGERAITAIRIYRTAGGDWLFVAEIPRDQSEYIDRASDGDLGEALPSLNWAPPPTDLRSLVAMPAGFLAGLSGRSVRCSAPMMPHAWPEQYTYTFPDELIGLAVSMDTLVIAGRDNIYLLTGSAPEALSPAESPLQRGCLAETSITAESDGVICATADGLAMHIGENGQIITEDILSRPNWLNLRPEQANACVYNNQYFFWTESAGYAINLRPEQKWLIRVTPRLRAMYIHPEDDRLYGVQDGRIVCWAAGENHLEATWTSRPLLWPWPWAPVWARVQAASHPVTFRLYREGRLIWEKQTRDNEAFILPQLTPAKDWQMEVQTRCEVYELTIGDDIEEIKAP